LPNFTYLLEEE